MTEKLAQLKVFEARTVDDESLPALRGKLVDLAKETGCSIRRLNVGRRFVASLAAGRKPDRAGGRQEAGRRKRRRTFNWNGGR